MCGTQVAPPYSVVQYTGLGVAVVGESRSGGDVGGERWIELTTRARLPSALRTSIYSSVT